MTCFAPLQAYKSLKPKKNGKHSIAFNSCGDSLPLSLACGQCIGCRITYSKQWAIRCHHEAQMHEENCFITLTYNAENLPYDRSLNIDHFQKFMKKFRKKYPEKKIRFFHCGEYGEKLGRPHYHACIFNFDFPDKEFAGSNNDVPYYNSQILSDLWGKGFVSVGDVTYESAAYVARYIMKKITGEQAYDHYLYITPCETHVQRKPEYTTMSRRDGIGKIWYDQYKQDVYPDDFIILKKDGSKERPPKYYDGLFELENPVQYGIMKNTRELNAAKNDSDNTPERLAVREYIQKYKLTHLPRTLKQCL